MKAIFTRGPIQHVRLVFAVIASIVLMVLDHHGQHVVGMRRVIATVLSPIMYIAEVPTDLYGAAATRFASRADLERDYKRLQDEQFLYRTQLQRLVSLESENARLRALLGSARKTRGDRKVAEIIHVDLEASEKQVLINKGERDGVYEGQAVIDAFGVLGQVVEVAQTTARVLLVTVAPPRLNSSMKSESNGAFVEPPPP